MQYVAFDFLAWVACAYFLVRLCKSDDPRWWVAIGASIGFGMLTKYSMLVCAAGIVVGILVTDLRRHLRSKWLWIGVTVSLLIFLPNFVWQVRHDFVSLEFLRHIHGRDVEIGRTKDFLPDQLLLTLLAFPLAVVGLYFYFFSRDGRRFRALGWLYVIPFVLFLIAKGRGYYMVSAYPLLYAGGAVKGELWLGRLRRGWSRTARGIAWSAIMLNVLVASALLLPLAPINSRWWNIVMKVNGEFREEIGWPELVETVAQIRDSLPEPDRTRVAILCGNYGEAGAINLYGPRYGLPRAISGVNSFWERGYGDPPPEALIVIGLSRQFLERNFSSCELAGRISNRYRVDNEETRDHPGIFVCRGLRRNWPEFWRNFRHYG